ncbi:helix-turn-helix domain-containing protein [Silvimonas soli]|uniref:helix-turn-helix domain-containing protein n=1 Tax=Silvimonas soli TaxID=2980100 RepID=UPI0024B367C7|nr:helix-turn-helix domain-containing protein [Silvimonas soli]
MKIKIDLRTPAQGNEALAELGARLRFLRKEKGLTIPDLAGRMLISENTLRSLELGASGVSVGTLVNALYHLGELDSLARLAPVDATLVRKSRKQSNAALKPVRDDERDF